MKSRSSKDKLLRSVAAQLRSSINNQLLGDQSAWCLINNQLLEGSISLVPVEAPTLSVINWFRLQVWAGEEHSSLGGGGQSQLGSAICGPSEGTAPSTLQWRSAGGGVSGPRGDKHFHDGKQSVRLLSL